MVIGTRVVLYTSTRVNTGSSAVTTKESCTAYAATATSAGAGSSLQALNSSPRTRQHPLVGRKAGDLMSENQAMHIVRAFVRVHRLEVRHVPHRVIFDQDSVAAEEPS